MNNIGKIQLEKEIKILDAFDFPEEFSSVSIPNIKDGTWIAFNQIVTMDEDIGEKVVSKIVLVEEEYFKSNPKIASYEWAYDEQDVSVEKGVIGVFNTRFKAQEKYMDAVEETVSSETQAGTFNNCFVCNSGFGNDDIFKIHTVNEDNKVVAIQVDFNISD